MSQSVAAIVLAGGASSRFGTDKLVATLYGTPMLHHALNAVAMVADRIVIVIAPGAAEPAVPTGLASRIAIARDDALHQGPLAGLAAGLAACPSNAEVAIIVGGDMPSLQAAVLTLLADAIRAHPALGAATLEADPPSALPVAVRPSIAAPAVAALLADNRRALRGLLAAIPSMLVPAADWRAVDPDSRTLRDIDVPEDLVR